MVHFSFFCSILFMALVSFSSSTPVNTSGAAIVVRGPEGDDQCPASSFDMQCTDAKKKAVIEEELTHANGILQTTGNQREAIASTDFYKDLLDAKNKNRPGFPLEVSTKFEKLAGLYTDTKATKVKITCEQNNDCVKRGRVLAATTWKEHLINFCDRFFDDAESVSTATIINECRNKATQSKWQKLDAFWESKSATVVHELFHLGYIAADPQKPNADRAKDYAYGVADCKNLALGKHVNTQLCFTGGMDFICPEERSFQNADTLALIGAGVYFSETCGIKIQVASTESRSSGLVGDDLDQTGP